MDDTTTSDEPDRGRWPTLLETYLDALETVIRDDLSGRRAGRKQNWLLRMDLADALDDVEGARAELARYPEGARLAFHVVGAQLHRLRLAAEYADRYYHGARKGRANSAATRELAVPSSSVPL